MGTGPDPLLGALGEIADLGRARALLAWDERTQMPPRGAAIRAEQLATLTSLRHRLLARDGLGRLIDAAESRLGPQPGDSFEASLVRVGRREWEKARRVPAELRAEIARVTSIAEHAWEGARRDSDFGAFLPHLERVLDLQRRYIDCFEAEDPYDPLLDDFEPGMRTADLRPLLEALRDGVRALAAEIAASPVELDDSCLHGDFALPAQAELARALTASLPLEAGAWRLDPTVHPFAVGIGISDLRITTRFDRSHLGTALWAVIHEVGHALYQNGIAPELERTPLCRSASLGFDESQSRMWENWVGRGRPFAGRLLALLREHFPDRFAALDAESLYRAANRVEPSLIRVEADEVTYNLHIVLRFELELELIEGRLAAADLPQAWAARVQDYLGLAVPDDARGVLQDVHWASGSFGYFPTYALGNVIAAQLWALARTEIPGLDERLAAGDLDALRALMAERVYRHGGKLEPAELIESVVGGPLDPAALLGYLRAKFGELYGL
jgi:carboxypeptidase Taq